MKSSPVRKIGIIVTLFVSLLLCAASPAPVQAAAARVGASAEVINPAVIDSSRMLAEATAEPTAKCDAGPTEVEIRPEVKLVNREGVTWLSIDYN